MAMLVASPNYFKYNLESKYLEVFVCICDGDKAKAPYPLFPWLC